MALYHQIEELFSFLIWFFSQGMLRFSAIKIAAIRILYGGRKAGEQDKANESRSMGRGMIFPLLLFKVNRMPALKKGK